MRLNILIVFFCFFVFIQSFPIKKLTHDTIISFLNSSKFSIVLFYLPKCEYSKNIISILKQASKKLKKYTINSQSSTSITFGFGKINVLKEIFLSNSFKIQETPIIYLFKGEKPIKIFSGERTSENIYDFIFRETQYETQELLCEEIELFMKNNYKSVILFHEKESDNKKLLNNFRELKKYFTDISYGLSECEFYSSNENMIVFKNFKTTSNFYLKTEEDYNLDSMIVFINENNNNGIFVFEEKIIMSYLRKKIKIMILFTNDDTSLEYISRTTQNFKLFAENYRNLLKFSVAFNLDFKNKNWLNFIDFNSNFSDISLIIVEFGQFDNLNKYIYMESDKKTHKQFNLSYNDILNFYFSYKNNTLKPYIRSEKKINFNLNKTNFIRLVASNFEEIVYDRNKDVLVAFCPERYLKCIDLWEILNQVADDLFHLIDFLICKFDPEKNDFIGRPIGYFPTIRLYKSIDKTDVVELGDDISKEQIHNFLKRELSILDIKNIRINNKS